MNLHAPDMTKPLKDLLRYYTFKQILECLCVIAQNDLEISNDQHNRILAALKGDS